MHLIELNVSAREIAARRRWWDPLGASLIHSVLGQYIKLVSIVGWAQ